MKFARALIAAFAVVFLGCSCDAADLPVVKAIFSGPGVNAHEPLNLEVVSTDGGRAQGLMYRKHMESNAGMLFLFPVEQELRFWMKNTLIPLDMIFIDSKWKVVGVVANAVPLTEEPRGVSGMSKYVIELNGGVAKILGVTAGSTVKIEGTLPTAQ